MGIGKHAVFNGEIILTEEATLPVTRREVQCNYSVYESLKVFKGKPIFVNEHIQRLGNSALGLGFRLEAKSQDLVQWIEKLIKEDSIEKATLRILLVGGNPQLLFITAKSILTYPKSCYKNGVIASIFEGERYLPTLKTSNLLVNYLALEKGKKEMDAFEAVLMDRKGRLIEGTRSNFYGIKDKVLYTPGLDLVLSGITRDNVLKVSKNLGYEIKMDEYVTMDNIAAFDEFFISSTSMLALPLKQLGPREMKNGFEKTLEIYSQLKSLES